MSDLPIDGTDNHPIDRALGDRAVKVETPVISYFNYINRVVDGLRVDLEEGMSTARHVQEALQ